MVLPSTAPFFTGVLNWYSLVFSSIQILIPYKEEVTGSNPVAPTRVFQKSLHIHDSSGTFQWSKTFGGVGGFNNRVQDIVIDSNDFVITVGQITGNTNFSTVGGDTIDFGNNEYNWVLKIKSDTGLID